MVMTNTKYVDKIHLSYGTGVHCLVQQDNKLAQPLEQKKLIAIDQQLLQRNALSGLTWTLISISLLATGTV